ncbi:MAG: ABC-F family ATP-binding cassette domain-containing protein [Bacteroidales bacterium]|jgi:ATP-binding cassette subfamily F protein 3|nr:ABC-F family ATP-binding cassette domain-containing protein [Bacteroidales bacterium]
MVALRNIEVTFGSFTLMKDVSFLVNRQDRIGLAGRNGAGKTTLLRIMAGLQQPTTGLVEMPGGISIGYLPQQMKVSNETTVFEETLAAFSGLLEMEASMERMRVEVGERSDYHDDSYMHLCTSLAITEERYALMGGNSFRAETGQTLSGLGFDQSDLNRPTSELSGGWRMRIELAKVLLAKPGLLLLDEPTNHLDIESIRWFEQYLKDFPGPVVLVSHDRAFLDNVTTRTIEISAGRIHDYRVPFSRYEMLRRERREQLEAAWRNQQKMIEDTERFIERFRYKATKAVQVQARIKQLDKLERIEMDREEMPGIDIRFAPAPRSGTVVVEAEHLGKAYGNHMVLENCGIIIERGEKVAFVGRNGEGKTTFARIITTETGYSGKLKIGHNVRVGYYAQNQDELLSENKTVFQTIDEIATGDIRPKVRDLLGAFLFHGDEIEKKVKVLSGGERSRLALIKLLLEPFNLLLLDEPTNHLDLRSKEILKKALLNFDGTLIIVSHDRDFLDGLVTKVYEFRNRKILQHIGGIYDFLEKKDREKLNMTTESSKRISQSSGDSTPQAPAGKMIRKERKEYSRSLRKLEKAVTMCEERISALELETGRMDEVLRNPVPPPGEEFFARYRELRETLAKEMETWEKSHNDLETLLNDNAG